MLLYALLVVALFVPVLGALYARRARSEEPLAAIAAGVAALFAVRFVLGSRHPWLDPTLADIRQRPWRSRE